MRPATSRWFARRVLPFVLAIPLVAIPVGAYLVASEGSRAVLFPVAQGATGGVFHPIAGEFIADETELAGCDSDEACLEQSFGNISYRRGAESRARALRGAPRDRPGRGEGLPPDRRTSSAPRRSSASRATSRRRSPQGSPAVSRATTTGSSSGRSSGSRRRPASGERRRSCASRAGFAGGASSTTSAGTASGTG